MLKNIYKIFFLGVFILLLVFGFNYFQVKAIDSIFPWGNWTKYAGNPVLKDPDAQCFFPEIILSDVNDPLRQPILIAHPAKRTEYYWLYYDTCWRGGGRLAYSSDLINWTPYEQNPVITPVSGEVTLFIGQMFKDGDKFYIFYDITSGCPSGTCYVVKYSYSNSPFGPWTRGGIVLTYGGSGAWDEGRVTETFIQKYNDIYYMYYMGDLPQPFGRKEQVGIATTPASKFPAGPWAKQGLKLPVNPDPTAWDRGLVADPSAIQVGDKFYLLYTGSWINAKWMIGIAWADHPLGPWNRPSAPILSPGPAGSWESDSILRGAIHYFNGKFYLPYAGSDGQNYRGGLATARAITSLTPTPTNTNTPTPSVSITVTPNPTNTPTTPTPTMHSCPNYWTNCVRQDIACPAGTVNDPYGSCGANFRCCNPNISVPTPTPTILPTLTPIPSPTSVPGTPLPFRFIAWSDTHDGLAIFSSLSDQAFLLNPAMTLYSGDLEDNGFTFSGATAWKNAANGQLTGNTMSNGLFDKTFVVRGNHDTQDTLGWQAFYDLSRVAGNTGVTNYNFMTGKSNLTYSFDYGNSHFAGLDVGGDASFISQSLINWLDSDLTSAEARNMTHAFIFFHGPIYCVNGHCDQSCTTRICPLPGIVENFISTVINRHPIITATFHGHEHVQAYTYIDNTRIPLVTKPFHQFVAGNAGAGPASCNYRYRYDYCINDYGFLTIDVSGQNFTVSWYKLGSSQPVRTQNFTKAGGLTPTPTPGEQKTMELFVANNSGDAYQQGGTVYVSGSQIKMGWYDNGVGFKIAGSGLADLKGKTIINAVLKVTSAVNTTSNIVQRIYLQASDGCHDFSADASDITIRPTTANSVWWNIGTGAWSINNRYSGPDMAKVVSEVIQRPSWGASSLCVILKEAGSANYAERYIYSKESGLSPASLRVTYR